MVQDCSMEAEFECEKFSGGDQTIKVLKSLSLKKAWKIESWTLPLNVAYNL